MMANRFENKYCGQPSLAFRHVRRWRRQAAKVPFLDDTPMDSGPPSCATKDFETPRLRKCPFDPTTARWKAKLGAGIDGCVWKVKFGRRGPFVLKVFWDGEPPDLGGYFAPQRECQNATLLQMIEAAVEDASARSSPILVNPSPGAWKDAVGNLLAFSDEGRLGQHPTRTQPVTSIPRIKKCYGWLKINTDMFRSLSHRLRPGVHYFPNSKKTRMMVDGNEYYGIVYEYVEEGVNELDTVQKSLDFFWLAGFMFTSSHEDNWKSGILVDFADIVDPGGFGWTGRHYSRDLAAEFAGDGWGSKTDNPPSLPPPPPPTSKDCEHEDVV